MGFALIGALTSIIKNDNRRAPRHACNMNAWVRPEGSFKTRACRVLDVSELGVRFRADDADSIPDRFRIFLNKGDLGREASVKWRSNAQIGAELRTAATSHVDATAPAKNHGPVLGLGALGAILSISMCALAGTGGAGIAFGIILIVLGLRVPAAA